MASDRSRGETVMSDYAFISSDSHLEVLPERWSDRAPARFRELMPRTVRHPDGGDAIHIEGAPLFQVAYLDLRAGRTDADWKPFDVKVEETAGVGPPDQRLREQDADGCAAEVLFANMQAGPTLWRNIRDDEAYLAAVRAYNGWLAEEYCSVDPKRLLGLGVIPWSGVDDAIREMEFCASAGLAGVSLGAFPNGNAYPLPEDDRFWAAALEMQMRLTVHVGFFRGGERASQPAFRYPVDDPEILRKTRRGIVEWVAFLGLPPALSFSQLILSGVFDRYPALRLYFAETRLGWIPFWMEEADTWYERHRHWAQRYLGFEPIERLPSEYIKDHFLFSVQLPERVAIELREHIGLENIMFATDFPHIESEWPNTRPRLDRLTAALSPEERYKLVAGNVIDYFGLDPATLEPGTTED